MNHTVEQELSAWAQAEFLRLFPDIPAGTAVEVVAATDDAFGDYQCNAPMALARLLKKPPRAIADTFAADAVRPASVASIDVAGPGFLNLRLTDPWLAERLVAMDADPRLGVPAISPAETIMIDYSSPNIAKPMHIAHIRSTVIGHALYRMLRFLGYRVLSDNHLGDWGTQFGILIMGYHHFLNEDALAADPIAELERVYVLSSEQSKNDEAWMDRARKELVKLQQGDKENRSDRKSVV